MAENIDKLLAIFFSILIFAQAYCIRSVVGTWIFPACLFSIAWFVFTFFPLVVLFNVPIEPLSVLFIALCVFSFSLSALPFNWAKAFENNKRKDDGDSAKFNSGFICKLFWFSSVSAIVFTVISVISNGFYLYSMIFDILDTSGKYAAMRGQGELDYGNWGRASIIFTYTTAVLGGLIFYGEKKRVRKFIFIFMAFAPSLFVMLTQSAKLILFLSIAFFYGSIFVRKIYSNKLKLVNGAFFARLIGYGLLLFPLVAISFLSRGTSDSDDATGIFHKVSNSFFSYVFGHLYAFSDWFSHYLGARTELNYSDSFFSYGNYTFQSIFDLFGSQKIFPAGVYEEYFSYQEMFTTNIYTIFRGLIYDFGSVGTLLFMFLLGLVIHAFFYRLLSSRNSWVSCVVFIISIVCFQASFIISLFMARYMYLLCVVLFLFLAANDFIWKRYQVKK